MYEANSLLSWTAMYEANFLLSWASMYEANFPMSSNAMKLSWTDMKTALCCPGHHWSKSSVVKESSEANCLMSWTAQKQLSVVKDSWEANCLLSWTAQKQTLCWLGQLWSIISAVLKSYEENYMRCPRHNTFELLKAEWNGYVTFAWKNKLDLLRPHLPPPFVWLVMVACCSATMWLAVL